MKEYFNIYQTLAVYLTSGCWLLSSSQILFLNSSVIFCYNTALSNVFEIGWWSQAPHPTIVKKHFNFCAHFTYTVDRNSVSLVPTDSIDFQWRITEEVVIIFSEKFPSLLDFNDFLYITYITWLFISRHKNLEIYFFLEFKLFL